MLVTVGVNRVNNGIIGGSGRTEMLPGAVIVISKTTATGVIGFISPRTAVIVKA